MLPKGLASLLVRETQLGTSETGDQINEMRARDDFANQYDGEFTTYQNRVEFKATLERFVIDESDVLLDAGCSTGRFTELITGSGHQLVAVDFSMASLRKLMQRLDVQARKTVHPVQGDIVNLPLRAEAIDKCLSCEVLEHIPSRDAQHRVISELQRVLRPGGRLVISTYNYNYYWRKKSIRQGYHAGRIYFETLTRPEFRKMLQPQFNIEGLWGIHNRLPKGLNEKLGKAGYWLDRTIERTQFSDLFATLLLAQCVKMGDHSM
jgi:ubiquinone/menaquinone biosynthesis C-methylase UbiE